MREKTQSSFYIRKYYILILLVSLCPVILCTAWGFFLLHSQHMRELAQIGNIAGTILSEYPDAEDMLLSALQDDQYSYMNEGYAVLHKYGYRENLMTDSRSCYRQAFKGFASILALILCCDFALVTFFFSRFSRSQEKQEQLLHTLLDRYLSEDYAILDTSESFAHIFSESFTDTLYKLGNKLKTKTQALAEERDHTKTLVTDISHQLKTPVSALKSCFSMCKEAETETERSDFLQRCEQQMHKLEDLITVLVNVSRLETSLITLRRETVLLSALLTDAVNTVYEKALQKEISIEICNSDSEDVLSTSLSVDRRWTAEAMANILDNAVKYSPAGSRIRIDIHKFYSYIQLDVTDQGIGIPKEEYNQVFKRFYRGSHPVIKQTEGSGVGLYLARQILEKQGGAVTAKPAVGRGAVFSLRFPL